MRLCGRDASCSEDGPRRWLSWERCGRTAWLGIGIRIACDRYGVDGRVANAGSGADAASNPVEGGIIVNRRRCAGEEHESPVASWQTYLRDCGPSTAARYLDLATGERAARETGEARRSLAL